MHSFLLLLIILQQIICNGFAIPLKRDKTYKVPNIANNIHLTESNTHVDRLGYIGLTISEVTALLTSFKKFYTGIRAISFYILFEPKQLKKSQIEAPKLLKATIEQHSESEEDEENYESEHEEEKRITPKQKVKLEVHPKILPVKPVIRPELLTDLLKFVERFLLPYYNWLISLASESLVHESRAHLNGHLSHDQILHNQQQLHYNPHHVPVIDQMQYKRRKRGALEKSRDLSAQEVRAALESSKSNTKEEIIHKLEVFMEGIITIVQLLTGYEKVLPASYNHCTDDVCVHVISKHLIEFAKQTRELNDQLKTKFLKDPEFQVKTAEELHAECNSVITRAEALVKGVNVKEEKKELDIDSDTLWKAFELDLTTLQFQKYQPITNKNWPQLKQLVSLVSQELTKAQEYEFKLSEYAEMDPLWISILLNSLFQVKRIEKILEARWHEISAFKQDKDHTNHSFRNWMYYQGEPPVGLKAHDSGAAVYMIIENALECMNILNECVSINANNNELHIDWDKMARMGPFGRSTAAKLIENQEKPFAEQNNLHQCDQ